MTLTNTTGTEWAADPEDFGFVHGHFLDENGQPPQSCHFGYSRADGEWKDVSLGPGASVELPVRFSHDSTPGPGSYGIEAILVSLNLRSPKGALEIVPAPTPTEAPNLPPTKR